MKVPSSYQQLPAPLPPGLCKYAGVTEGSRYVAFSYECSKPTWLDGRSYCTFSSYGVWQPWTTHLTMQIFLWEAQLGSDEETPNHVLLADRGMGKVYLAPRDRDLYSFLQSQHPPTQAAPPDRWMPDRVTLGELQDRGLFEILGPCSLKHRRWAMEITSFLDQYIDQRLFNTYKRAASEGDTRAIVALKAFVERTRPVRRAEPC